MESEQLQACVEAAAARIQEDQGTDADRALIAYHRAALEFTEHMENQDRALDLYRENSQTPADVLRQLSGLHDLQRKHAATLAENHSLRTYLGERASSHRWETIKKNYNIRQGKPVPSEIQEYVETLLANLLRYKQ